MGGIISESAGDLLWNSQALVMFVISVIGASFLSQFQAILPHKGKRSPAPIRASGNWVESNVIAGWLPLKRLS